MVVAAIDGLRTECDTRMLLDATLHTICAHREDFFIRTEQSMKFVSLRNTRLHPVLQASTNWSR